MILAAITPSATDDLFVTVSRPLDTGVALFGQFILDLLLRTGSLLSSRYNERRMIDLVDWFALDHTAAGLGVEVLSTTDWPLPS